MRQKQQRARDAYEAKLAKEERERLERERKREPVGARVGVTKSHSEPIRARESHRESQLEQD